MHGKGVFATRHLAAGERVIEYVGEVITMAEAIARHPHDAANPDHTFYFHLDDGRVIDALHGGNDSKWINHSCRPNCVPDEDRGRYNTLAGMTMLLLGRLPRTADVAEWGGWRFEIIDLDGKRVDKVLATRIDAPLSTNSSTPNGKPP